MNVPTPEAQPQPAIEDYVKWEWNAPLILLRKNKDGYGVVCSWDGTDPEACREARDHIKAHQWWLRRNPGQWVR